MPILPTETWEIGGFAVRRGGGSYELPTAAANGDPRYTYRSTPGWFIIHETETIGVYLHIDAPAETAYIHIVGPRKEVK